MGFKALAKGVGWMKRMEKKLMSVQNQTVNWIGADRCLLTVMVIEGVISGLQKAIEGSGGSLNSVCV